MSVSILRPRHICVVMLSVCVCNRMYFVWEPLIQPNEYKWRWSDKSRAAA